jgi:alkanesulfonate monooxygenase SsuD/methylene tetrahydromethanopterin reductase-like flavin-dependent oxidoreductase (luciferase family)
VQSHIPVLVGAAGTEKNFKWIARSADGWITTPRDFDIDAPVKLLQDTWAAAERDGAPQIVALDFKPDPDKLARWAELGVTEVLFGLPDKSEADVAAYVERLAGKLAALV